MKFIRLITASLTVLALSLNASGLLEACDQCRGRMPCRACGTSDDRGLLDGLDRVAQRLQPRLPQLNLPRIPSLDTALKLAIFGRGGAAGCTTCGCELSEPSCGCESSQVCDCQRHAGNDVSHEHHQFFNDSHYLQDVEPAQRQPQLPPSATHQMAPYAAPTPAPQRIPLVEPSVPARPSAPHIDDYQRVPQFERHPSTPTPLQPRVPELVPLPDSEVDPFRDDAATRVRRIPSRTIQYRQPTSNYGQNYDPQASHDGVRLRWTDEAPTTSPRLALDEKSSSRTRSPQATNQPETVVAVPLPEVVTASGQAQPNSPSTYYQPNSQTARPIEHRNPLRGN